VVIVRDDPSAARSPPRPGVQLQGGRRCVVHAEHAADLRWYMAGLVFKWLKSAGGLAATAARNRIKAQTLYAAIDASPFYDNPVAKDARSWMNVTFHPEKAGLGWRISWQSGRCRPARLKGHRVLGGMRASLYNAMPLAGVEALSAFMREFERRHA